MNPILTLENVSLEFPDMDRSVLQDIQLSIYPGDRLILLGSNGSGKSSLIKLIQGIQFPTNGEIQFLGKPLKNWKMAELAKNLISLNQDLRTSLFFDLSVFENCLLWSLRQEGSFFQIKSHAERIFFSEYLKGYHPKLSDKLDIPLRLLSGGEKQALLLALCLRHPPKLLLLDEHTSALDPSQSEKIMALTIQRLNQHQVTSIICTHNLEHALKYGNRLIALQNGKIIFDVEGFEKQKVKRDDLLGICY